MTRSTTLRLSQQQLCAGFQGCYGNKLSPPLMQVNRQHLWLWSVQTNINPQKTIHTMANVAEKQNHKELLLITFEGVLVFKDGFRENSLFLHHFKSNFRNLAFQIIHIAPWCDYVIVHLVSPCFPWFPHRALADKHCVVNKCAEQENVKISHWFRHFRDQ